MSSMKYEELKAKIETIVNQPIRKFKPEELIEIVNRYEKNHGKSKEAFERAQKIIPGGVEHNLAFNYPFPLTSKRVFDCYMETIDDILLTDYLMDGGPIILGHNHPGLTEKVLPAILPLITRSGACLWF